MFVRFVSFRVRTFVDVVYYISEHPCVARFTAPWSIPGHSLDMVPKGESLGMLYLLSWSPGARRTRSSASTRSCCTAHDCKQLKLLNNKLLSRFAWLTSTLQQLKLIILINLSATLAPLRLVLTEDLPVSRFLVLWPCGMIAQHHHLLTT